MSVNKKKVATSVTAVGLAALILLGGSFAWQSISQTALNEASDTVNPGGRLHDDFDGTNKDVYVENFADEPIYARIRLDEYFEIVNGSDTLVVTEGADKDDKSTWLTHYFPDGNLASDYWEWSTGGSTIYMPTFNKNKDSLVADINGTYEQGYEDYIPYEEDQTKSDDAIYDADTNDTDDENVTNVSETHTATSTLGAELISMQAWMEAGSPVGEYWVYDTDGWVYWADAIQPDTATGLLLDGIELTQVMDDSWYYAINVVAQFITADDLGKSDNTGFYDTNAGTEPTDEALKLLEAIGVDTGNSTSVDDGEILDTGTLQGLNMSLYSDNEYIKVNESINTLYIKPEGGWQQVYLNLEHDTLDILFGDTTRTAYKWDDTAGEYKEHSSEDEPWIIDINCYDDGLDLNLCEEAGGSYKVTSTYSDSEGNTYEGSIEFTIEIYEEPQFFERLVFSMDSNTSSSNSYFDDEKGYMEPGDYVDFGAAYWNSDDGWFNDISNVYLTWDITGNESSATTINDTGVLTIGEDEPTGNLITISLTYTNNEQGIEITSEHYVMASSENIVLTIEMAEEGPYYACNEYAFTATAKTESGTEVETDWDYDIVTLNEESDSTAVLDGNVFNAYDGDYYVLKAFAKGLSGRYAELEVDVIGIGCVKLWDVNVDIENTEPVKIVTESESWVGDMYYFRIYDTHGNVINDATVTGYDNSIRHMTTDEFATNYIPADDNFTDPYYIFSIRGETGSCSIEWHNDSMHLALDFE